MKPISDAHVVVLNNYITPHHKPVYQALARRVGHLTLLLSTPMEANRNWQPEWGDLDVRVQQNWTLKRKIRHAYGYQDDNYVHIPYDTISQLNRLRPDVLVSYELGFRTLCSTWTRWRQRLPLVTVVNVSQHTENRVILPRRILRSFLKNRSEVFTYNGPSCRAYLQGAMGISDDRLFHVPYASDPAKHYLGPVERLEKQQFDLLYTGQLNSRKGIKQFLAALTCWADDHPSRSILFRIAGDGPLRGELEAMEHGANLQIEFLGHCDAEQLTQLYQQAGIYVFPTMADEWGMVAEEAWMAGLPILGSEYAQSFETFCREGENGWMFQPNRSEQIYEAIDRAFHQSSERLQAMRHGCRETVRHRTPEYAADRFIMAMEAAIRIRENHK